MNIFLYNENCYIYIRNIDALIKKNTNFWESDFCELIEPKLVNNDETGSPDEVSLSEEEGRINEDIEQHDADVQIPQRKMQNDLFVVIENFNFFSLKIPNSVLEFDLFIQ